MSETLAAIERIWRRVLLTVGRGRVMTGNDAGNAQLLQVRLGSNEVRDNTPRLAEYGFASMPLSGADAVLLFVAGDRSNGVVIATGDQRYRLKSLTPGEVALYTDEGDHVYMKRGRVIEIAAGGKVRMVTPLLEVTGDIKDNCDTTGRTMAGDREIYDSHTHVVRNVQGGTGTATTDAPTQQE